MIWWANNLKLSNGRSLVNWKPKMKIIVSSDPSITAWGAYFQSQRTGGPWSKFETKEHINLLELKAASFAILLFSKTFISVKVIHLQTDYMVALSYFPKMGVTHDKILSAIAKKIWEYLLANGIMVTVECLPGILNA